MNDASVSTGPDAVQALVSAGRDSASFIRPSLIQTWMPTWANGPVEFNANGFTFGRLDSVEAPFAAYRLILANYQTSGPMKLGRILAAPSARASLAFPTDADDAERAARFDILSVNGDKAPVLPAATTGPGGGLVPALVVTDWVSRASVERRDGGSLPLIHSFVVTRSAGACHVLPGAADPTWRGLLNGRLAEASLAYSDRSDVLISGKNDSESFTGQAGYAVVVGVQTLTAARGLTLMCVGDSLARGWSATNGLNSYGLRATLDVLSKGPERPVSFIMHGWDGSKTEDFIANARVMFDLARPQIVTIPTSSPNNNGEHAAQLSTALQFADHVMQEGSLPVLVTPWPFGSLSAENVATARTLRAMASPAMPVFDLTEAVLGGRVEGVGAMAPPEFYASDAHHGSDVGYTIVGHALGKKIRQLAV